MDTEEGVLWCKRLEKFKDDGTPFYGEHDYISISFEYGFELYWFDFVVPSKISMKDITDMANKFLSPADVSEFSFYLTVDGMSLDSDFKALKNDEDVSNILSSVKSLKEKERAVNIYCVKTIDCVDDELLNDEEVVNDEQINKVTNDGQVEESEDVMTDSEYDNDEDDLDYEANIDEGVEYAGVGVLTRSRTKLTQVESELAAGIPQKYVGEDYNSDDGLDAYESDNCDNRPTGVEFNPHVNMHDPQFQLMLRFKDIKQFGQAVKAHALKRGKDVDFAFRKRHKAKAYCRQPSCPWNVYVSRDPGSTDLIVKTLNTEHACGRVFHSNFASSSWIAEVCLDKWKEDPNRCYTTIVTHIWENYSMNVSKSQVFRAKEIALRRLNGSATEQYAKLWDYAAELRRRNPGSTVLMQLVNGSVEKDEPQFERFYVCLEGLKKGFKECRPLLSVDGCFLKGQYGGQLLCASGIDPNNNWYPIAWAVTESECKDSWMWFLGQLKEDLEIGDSRLTVMSDKQKGLREAVKFLFPNVEHRFCVMHMLGNMRNAGFKGITYKEFLWNAARATTVARFEHWMKKIAEHDMDAFHWFDDKPPENWSRSAFREDVKCDILLNNLSESFNSYILAARDMPILSCLEAIRRLVMVRLENNRTAAATKWTGKLCPKIFKELEKRKSRINECIPYSSGNGKFEVKCSYDAQYSVSLKDNACTCRKWDLSGIPCSHAIACMNVKGINPEDFVDECYTTACYRRVYRYMINPMDGQDMWPRSGYRNVRPPPVRKQLGRPKKNRRKNTFDKEKEAANGREVEIENHAADGTSSVKRMVLQQPYTCSVCKFKGHNKRTCLVAKQRAREAAEFDEALRVEEALRECFGDDEDNVATENGEPNENQQANENVPLPQPGQGGEPNEQGIDEDYSVESLTQIDNLEKELMTNQIARATVTGSSNAMEFGESQDGDLTQEIVTQVDNVSRDVMQEGLRSSMVEPPVRPTPSGVMQMVTPFPRQMAPKNTCFNTITTSAEGNKEVTQQSSGIIQKGGKDYIMSHKLNSESLKGLTSMLENEETGGEALEASPNKRKRKAKVVDPNVKKRKSARISSINMSTQKVPKGTVIDLTDA